MNRIRQVFVLSTTIALLALAARADESAVSEVVDPAVTTTPAASRPLSTDRLQLDTTSIRGNQELPRVLYIVPWKDPAMGNLVGKPVNSLIDEVLAPVDRDVFRRQTNYFDQLYTDTEGAYVNRAVFFIEEVEGQWTCFQA
jgi:hypothetical protein